MNPDTLQTLKQQRDLLQQMVNLKNQLAAIDPIGNPDELKRLNEQITNLTQSLNQVGIKSNVIDAFYEAATRGTQKLNDALTSMTRDISDKLKNMFDSGVMGAEDFKKMQSDNIDLLSFYEKAIQNTMNAETVFQQRRRDNTRFFATETLKSTEGLLSIQEKLNKNYEAFGTSKFKTFSVEKEIADVLLLQNELEQYKTQLGAGYYGTLKGQNAIILETLENVKDVLTMQESLNEQVKNQTAENQRKLEVEKEYLQYLAEEEKQLQKSVAAVEKIQAEWEKFEDARSRRTQKRLFAAAQEIQKEVDDYFAAEKKKEEAELARIKKIEEEQEKADKATIQRSRDRLFVSELARQKREVEIQKEVDSYFAAEAKKEEVELARIKKIEEEQKKIDDAMVQRSRARTLAERQREVLENEKKQRELDKIAAKELKNQETLKNKIDNTISAKLDTIISKLPGGNILSSLSSLGIIVQLLALAIGIILSGIFKWDALTANIAKSMSITRVQADATAKAAGSLASDMNMTNIFLEQVVTGIQTLSQAVSGINIATPFIAGSKAVAEMVQSTSILVDNFGMAASEINTLLGISVKSNETLSSTTLIVEAMARGVFNVSELFKAIARFPAALTAGFRGSNTQLVGMAMNMRRLGVEASTVLSSQDSLLEIESAISKAFEAQVITGQNIDIDRLMFLSFSGRPDLLLQEQLNALRRSNFLQQAPIFQQAIAQGIGLDVETASQMMLNDLITNRLGLTDQVIRQKQQEGVLMQDMLDTAQRQGKLTEFERTQLQGIAKEYDMLTIPEKFTRSVDNLKISLSALLSDLTAKIGELVQKLGELTKTSTAFAFNLSPLQSMITSTLGGVLLLGGGILLARSGINTVGRLFAGSGAAGGGGLLSRYLGSSANSAAAASATRGTAASRVSTLLKNTKGMGVLGGLSSGVSNLLSGRSPLQSIMIGATSGAGAFFGGALGSLLGPAGTVIGAAAGGIAGDMFANWLYDTLEPTSASQMQTQSQFTDGGFSANISNLNSGMGTATGDMSLQFMMQQVSAKLDTANSLLAAINQKSTNVTVELDGETVGKGIMNYNSGVIDRNRSVGNTFGNVQTQIPLRPR